MDLPAQIKIGSRKSPLAMAQAELVKKSLLDLLPALHIEIMTFQTSGDLFLGSLSEVGGKGLFTKEIEDALLAGQIDIAVHSMKDMPTDLPTGLIIPCVLPRENPLDVLVCALSSTIEGLPQNAKVGTSSLRRTSQLKALRPDLQILPLRGNVGTRMQKLANGEYNALVLAAAGLKRLGIWNEQVHVIPADLMLPAVAQGAIGVECRADALSVMLMLEQLNDPTTANAVAAERAMLKVLDGSCKTPIGGYATLIGGILTLEGYVGRPDGQNSVKERLSVAVDDAQEIGHDLGQAILSKMGKDFFK